MHARERKPGLDPRVVAHLLVAKSASLFGVRLTFDAARSEWRFQAATHNLLKLHTQWISAAIA